MQLATGSGMISIPTYQGSGVRLQHPQIFWDTFPDTVGLYALGSDILYQRDLPIISDCKGVKCYNRSRRKPKIPQKGGLAFWANSPYTK